MKKKGNSYIDKMVIFICMSVCILLFCCGGFITYNYLLVSRDTTNLSKNIYVGQHDMSGYSYDDVREKLKYYNDKILEDKIVLLYNDKELVVTYKELGLTVDVDSIIDDMKKYNEKLNYNDKIMLENGYKKKIFGYKYGFNNEQCIDTLNNLKAGNDIAPVDGHFEDNGGIKFIKGSTGYSLNVDASLEGITKEISKGVKSDKRIKLVVDESLGNNNPSYESIDTLVSTYSTHFNVWEGTRPTNLRTALGYINGVVVEPGETFSFYKYAGPFNKRGYVFYYEFVGNGVCQIATTTYNTALLGGLEIVKRYPHAKKSVYIEGGLDATVASYSSGWYVDMQWKNTYQYPIYIKAYANGGTATVEFWSNSNAKEGKTYATESVQIGARGYRTYLHTYKDGVEIDTSEIATTWYPES